MREPAPPRPPSERASSARGVEADATARPPETRERRNASHRPTTYHPRRDTTPLLPAAYLGRAPPPQVYFAKICLK